MSLTSAEIEQLLAVATLYVHTFKEDETMTVPERMRVQEFDHNLRDRT